MCCHICITTSLTYILSSRMVSKRVGTSLTSIFKIRLKGGNSFSCDLFNRGTTHAFTAFQVKLFANESSPGVIWFDTDTEWTSPASGSTMKGVSGGTDPTTLATESGVSFTIDYVGAYEFVEFLCSTAGNPSDVDPDNVEIFIGQGNN